jgi:hypothetical protein
MFGLFTRPSRRRPRNVRRIAARPTLRVEALEARANPAAPVLTNLSASWSGTNSVMITGQVQDDHQTGAVVDFGGAVTAAVHTDPKGNFMVALKTTGSGPVNIQAVDDVGVASPVGTVAYGSSPTTGATSTATATSTANGTSSFGGGTITNDGNGWWHIHGNVNTDNPLGTIIKISSSVTGVDGSTTAVNSDGTFDISFQLNPDTPGGAISITAIDQTTGTTTVWDGWIGGTSGS